MLILKFTNLKIKHELTVFHLIKQRNKYLFINMFLIPIEFRPVSRIKFQIEGRFSTNRVLLEVNNFGLNIQR